MPRQRREKTATTYHHISFCFVVRARIVSFGEILAVPWKTNLVLDCLHVGEPRPSVIWQHRMRSVRDNSKHQIFPNGSLSIQTLTETDQGEYSCSVQNLHGSDQILYQIIVQIPPVAPVMEAGNLTHAAVELTWTGVIWPHLKKAACQKGRRLKRP